MYARIWRRTTVEGSAGDHHRGRNMHDRGDLVSIHVYIHINRLPLISLTPSYNVFLHLSIENVAVLRVLTMHHHISRILRYSTYMHALARGSHSPQLDPTRSLLPNSHNLRTSIQRQQRFCGSPFHTALAYTPVNRSVARYVTRLR